VTTGNMSDAWAELQALKSKRDSRRKRLEERKKERQDILRGNPLKTESSLISSVGALQTGEFKFNYLCILQPCILICCM